MQRHDQVIQLSDHVKNKLKQYQYPTESSSLINSSNEYKETNDTSNDNDSLHFTSSENVTRPRHDTFTTYQVTQPSELFFTEEKSNQITNVSVLQDEYKKQHECQECIRRNHIIHIERQKCLRLYEENKKLNEQLRSSILRNNQYEKDIQKLKYHLTTMNSHLDEYQTSFDQLKQKIVSEKKTTSKIDKEKQIETDEDKHDMTSDHLKRLRYEIQMYNRLVAAKQQ
ncbi:unnamed protein product [Rotaria sp. Silwood1]|nr:unnamed protein product [Rotaria sp. Silwood1]CAF3461793.1 unnamed protein product [Rotaria sp. Silwood1]CAF4776797.1 unnamed protein product [Rotaria sp. Silwood1]